MIKRFSFLLVVLTAVLFSSCLKSNSGPAAPNPAGIFIVQASPNAPVTDIYINGQLSLPNITYGTDTGYAYGTPGPYELKIAEAGKTAYYVTKTFILDTGTLYSIYFIDSVSKMKAVAVADNFTIPDSDSVEVRYLDFCPDLTYHTIRFENTATSDVLELTGRSFNDQSYDSYKSDFTTIKGGTYNIKLFMLGSGTPFKTFENVQLLGSKAYTIYLKGFYNGTGTQAMGYGLIQHLL
ncbi:DUF4397 domain-containing protein [Panacibacter ginsenosidivorans]|uniref:DUF4397 domain-containing protein n=1 Tax=Panacibacter ginsenosidivorans TaxID=1813871 RepID=A0A5B8V6F6_9BACT|nr:DUF4397 domain-containing protein [Panacibacter ginsenosidivorans]QEC66321.1 DUF4397 domain-containing protein [Panacibacter ginsenosidivorans]